MDVFVLQLISCVLPHIMRLLRGTAPAKADIYNQLICMKIWVIGPNCRFAFSLYSHGALSGFVNNFLSMHLMHGNVI